MKISKNEARLLIVLGGILLFVVLYFVVNNRVLESTEEVEAELASIQPQLLELEALYADRATYLSEIESDKLYAAEQLAQYPAGIRPQDIIVWTLDLEEAVDFDVDTLTFGEAQLVAEFPAYVSVDGADVHTDLSAYKTTSNATGQLSYEQLKSSIDYIYATKEKTALDSVSISYDAETSKLAGNFVISKFFITYPQAEYQESQMPLVPIGTDELFGSTVAGRVGYEAPIVEGEQLEGQSTEGSTSGLQEEQTPGLPVEQTPEETIQ